MSAILLNVFRVKNPFLRAVDLMILSLSYYVCVYILRFN